MAHETHVLLVEHDSTDHDIYTEMLQYFFNKVTTVRLASTGVSVLLKRKIQFDLVMTSMNSPDSCGFQLLEVALEMNLVVILMSNNDDAITTMRILENGDLFGIKKPITMEIMRSLWQHVVSEKGRRLKQKEVIEQNRLANDIVHNVEGKYKSRKNDNAMFKKKVWVEWTEELHHKFMCAVAQLGEGRCYPRAILNLMNVPDLSRMQVASHLQRCRNAKWVPTSQRKTNFGNVAGPSTPSKSKAPRAKTMSFGSMPHTNDKINRQEFNFDILPSTETNVLRDYNLVGSSSNGYQYPQFLNVQECEQLGHVFGMDDEPIVVYGVQSVDPMAHITEDVFDFPEMGSMVLEPQQDLEMDFDGTLEALFLHQHQVPTVSNATNQWNQDGWSQ